VLLENLDLLDFPERPGRKETWVQLVRKEVQVFKVQEARQEKLEDQESLVRWDHLEKTDSTEKKEVQDHQEALVLLDFLDREVNLD